MEPGLQTSDDSGVFGKYTGIESAVLKLKSKYESAKLGSVKLCFEFFVKTQELIVSLKNNEINKQCALDKFVELKFKINEQFRWRLFVQSVVSTMIDMDEFSATMLDWLQSDPDDPAELKVDDDASVYFNWKTVLGIKKDLFLFEIGIKDLILGKLQSADIYTKPNERTQKTETNEHHMQEK